MYYFLMYIAFMKIGSPKELKTNEYKIGLNPSSVIDSIGIV